MCTQKTGRTGNVGYQKTIEISTTPCIPNHANTVSLAIRDRSSHNYLKTISSLHLISIQSHILLSPEKNLHNIRFLHTQWLLKFGGMIIKCCLNICVMLSTL